MVNKEDDYIPLSSSSTSTSTSSATHHGSSGRTLIITITTSFMFLFILFTYTYYIHSVENSSVLEVEHLPRSVSAGVSDKSNEIGKSVTSSSLKYPWTNSMLSWQRTSFHFQPQKNWMNDPNGPLFYKGWYHLFYQYNPNAAVWGDIVWAHAVSKDLIHWLYLPFAMVPDQWYDINGVWTGSATFLKDGTLVMLYTGATDQMIQVQNIAFPANLSDPLLLNWVKYSKNPVLTPPPGIGVKDFRDPTTAWLTSDGKWRTAIGSKIGKTGVTLLYDTIDFKKFEKVDGFMHSVNGTGMWECVDFYPVSKTSQNGLDTSANGPEVKHVLKASMDDTRIDYYAIGTYDDKRSKWKPDVPEMDVGYGWRYDFGKFYASKSFYDQNKGRRILWGWIGESDSVYADISKGWSSVQSVPRTVLIDRKTETNLLQWPVEELESLRSSKNDFKNIKVSAGEVLPLNVGDATQLDIIAEFEVDGNLLESTTDSVEKYECSTSGGSAQRGGLGPFGLLVLSDSNLIERTPVYFYIAKENDRKLKTFFCADQSRSSVANDVVKQVFGSFVPVLEGEKLTMRILVDHSIIESFAQEGRVTITSRVYPTKAIYGETKLFLFNNATKTNVVASVTVYQMESANIRPYPL